VLAVAGGLWLLAFACHALAYYDAWSQSAGRLGFLAAHVGSGLLAMMTGIGLVALSTTPRPRGVAVELASGYFTYYACLTLSDALATYGWSVLDASYLLLALAGSIGLACCLGLLIEQIGSSGPGPELHGGYWKGTVVALGLSTAATEVVQVTNYMGLKGLLDPGIGQLVLWGLGLAVLVLLCGVIWRRPKAWVLGLLVGYLWAWTTNIHAVVGIGLWIRGHFDPIATTVARVVALVALIAAAVTYVHILTERRPSGSSSGTTTA